MTVRNERARAVVQGLSLGDSLAWPSWWHRLALLSPKRATRLAQATEFAKERDATGFPTPYYQSSPLGSVDPAGTTDDAEWFAVAARSLLGQDLAGDPSTDGHGVWVELAQRRHQEPASVRGRLGTLMALDNLANGMSVPACGHDNAHYFDDIACIRALAAGLRFHEIDEAVAAARDDASVTHSEDGVWAAQGTAALVATLLGGAPVVDAVSAARAALPSESWTAAVVTEMLALSADSPFRLASRLEREVVDHVYSYATTGPETLGLLLTHLQSARSADELLHGCLSHPRHADSLVPLGFAIAAAAFGPEWLPNPPDEPLPVLEGVAIRALQGVRLDDVVTDLLTA